MIEANQHQNNSNQNAVSSNGKYFYYSSGGFEFLENYLCEIYGEERGKYIYNLQRYYDGEEFCQPGRQVDSLDDMQEVTIENLRYMVEREKHLYEMASKTVEYYDKCNKDGTLTDEEILAIAGGLGIYGGQVDWCDTLFPHVVDLFVNSKEMAKDLLKRGRDNIGFMRMAVGMLIDNMRDGQVLEQEGYAYWSLGYVRNYYRGENAYHVTGRSSLARLCNPHAERDPESENYDEKTAEEIRIGLLREREFCLWIRKLDFVQHWSFRPNDGALCQHYGLPSSYMDVTSDIRIALFFACCAYEGGRWRPLRDDEFLNADSREHVAKLGGDSRYGILFIAPADIISMKKILCRSMPNQDWTQVKPIGYQPFMRCANQKGYIIPVDIRYDMYQDTEFLKVKFRLTRELCDWIFDEMQGGEMIYGNDPAAGVADVAEAIKKTRCFSQATIESFLSAEQDLTREELMEYLEVHGYGVKEEVSFCTEERRKEIEMIWQQEIEEKIGQKKMVSRPIFVIA